MYAKQLKEYVIEPTLLELSKSLGGRYKKIYSPQAVKLLLMTAAIESDMGRYIIQNNYRMDEEKKALSIYQIEPQTIDFVINKFKRSKPLVGLFSGYYKEAVISNLRLATCICRFVYWYKTKEPIPPLDDSDGLWKYYKKWYNSSLGATTREEFFKRCKKHRVL